MRIWFEALTGKQAILFHHLREKVESLNHEVLITTRKYDYTESNLSRLGREFVSIGEYGGSSLKNKLVNGSKRIIELAEVIDRYKPDVLISFPSPDAFRTAFGLGIPAIQLNDTPHARAVGKLTISLSNALIHPKSIDPKEFEQHGVSSLYAYEGVDELQWIQSFTPTTTVLDELNLKKENYIVFRCEESKAAYFQELYPSVEPGSTSIGNIIDQIRDKFQEFDYVVFPRYPEQNDLLARLDVIIPEKSVDTQSLFAYSKAVMTGGGTMGRESALLGTPTVYSFPLELAVSKFIADKGFPLFHTPNPDELSKVIIKLVNTPKMDESFRINLLNEMETPFDGIKRAIKDVMGINL
ncbi:MAG: DUF354 domain-containing protein [Candidatus Kariarchaeaceae archaeon]|jgi:predicted glycosyltransferase